MDRIKEIIRETLIKYHHLLTEEGEKFRPTTEWMEKWYPVMNKELFGGSLGSCSFKPFLTGKGSSGKTLGLFKLTGRNLFIDRYSRRIYKKTYVDKEYINRENFVSLCCPSIELNANYSATEDGWLNTLVHEMCHYYTYMYGYAPKQAHGVEFRDIAHHVTAKSNGRFNIQRLTSAEEMREKFELDSGVLDKKLKNIFCIVVFKENGEIRLVPTSSNAVLDTVIKYSSVRDKIRVYNDQNFVKFVYNYIKFPNLRSYKFYLLNNEEKRKPVLDKLDDFPYREISTAGVE